MNNNIGNFIYKLRTEKKLSQQELADLIPITRQAVSKWERGITIPDSSTLLILSNIFDITINELLLGKREDKKIDLKEATLSIIDDNNQRTKNIKNNHLLVTCLIIFVFTSLFFGLYFLSSYNQVKVYELNPEINSNMILTDGLLIYTKDKIFLRWGPITGLTEEIKYVELYYIINDEKHLIIGSNGNLSVEEKYGYNEAFVVSKFPEILENLYLEVYYVSHDKINESNITTPSIKIKVTATEKYTNDNFINIKNPSI